MMVLRKMRRFACHPLGLIAVVAISCCMYVYVLIVLTATSGPRRGGGSSGVKGAGGGGGSGAANSSVSAGANGSPSLDFIRERHTRHLWDEVNRIVASKDHPSWQQFQAGVLSRAGPPLACSNKSSLNSSMNDGPASCDGALPRPPGGPRAQLCQSSVRGAIRVDYNLSLTWSDAVARVARHARPPVASGGAWCPPSSCRHQQSLAVIIPFRDRWRQLRNLLAVLHPMLQRQAAGCYRIFVVEQYGCGAFNKGRLNNAGFLEAMARHNFTCVVFQDTDIVPENDRNPYVCGALRPRHLAVAVDTNRYRLPYAALVGGVIAFQAGHFFRVNGYSNMYWGWGLEDDDMELRMKIATRLKYERPPASVARFKALPHKTQRIYRLQGARRKPLLKTALRRYAKEGLNTVQYRVLLASSEPLFTHLLVDVGEQPLDFELTGTE